MWAYRADGQPGATAQHIVVGALCGQAPSIFHPIHTCLLLLFVPFMKPVPECKVFLAVPAFRSVINTRGAPTHPGKVKPCLSLKDISPWTEKESKGLSRASDTLSLVFPLPHFYSGAATDLKLIPLLLDPPLSSSSL